MSDELFKLFGEIPVLPNPRMPVDAVAFVTAEELQEAWDRALAEPLKPKPFLAAVVHPSDAPAVNRWIDDCIAASLAERARRTVTEADL